MITFTSNIISKSIKQNQSYLFAFKIKFIFVRAKGCLTLQAEIIPYEPDAGNTAVGICS